VERRREEATPAAHLHDAMRLGCLYPFLSHTTSTQHSINCMCMKIYQGTASLQCTSVGVAESLTNYIGYRLKASDDR
jgi:hypothetical protein